MNYFKIFIIAVTAFFLSSSYAFSQPHHFVDTKPFLKKCKKKSDTYICTDKIFLDKIYKNIEYPSLAKEYNIQGKVILEYVIDSTGQLSLPIIKMGIGGGCDNAVLDAFNKVKDKLQYEPALLHGKKVSYKTITPILFKLKNIEPSGNVLIKNVAPYTYTEISLENPLQTFTFDGERLSAKAINQRNLDEIYLDYIEESNDTTHLRLISEKHFDDIGMVYDSVDVKPRFPYCENKELPEEEKHSCSQEYFLKTFYSNLRYPEIARENEEQGMVVSQFTIMKNGKMTNFKIIEGVSESLDKAVLNLYEYLASTDLRWIPAIKDNRHVASNYILPVNFRLGSLPGDSTTLKMRDIIKFR